MHAPNSKPRLHGTGASAIEATPRRPPGSRPSKSRFRPHAVHPDDYRATLVDTTGRWRSNRELPAARFRPHAIGPLQSAGAAPPRSPSVPRRARHQPAALTAQRSSVYGECMARLISTTVRLAEADVRALRRARKAGHSASELVRKGLRVVASRYYSGRRPPSTRLFESTDAKLGDEAEL